MHFIIQFLYKNKCVLKSVIVRVHDIDPNVNRARQRTRSSLRTSTTIVRNPLATTRRLLQFQLVIAFPQPSQSYDAPAHSFAKPSMSVLLSLQLLISHGVGDLPLQLENPCFVMSNFLLFPPLFHHVIAGRKYSMNFCNKYHRR